MPNATNIGMKSTIRLGQSGRLVLPRKIRDLLHIRTGDTLEIETGPNEIRLRPAILGSARICREEGRVYWDAPGSHASIEEIEKALASGRDERDSRASGML